MLGIRYYYFNYCLLNKSDSQMKPYGLHYFSDSFRNKFNYSMWCHCQRGIFYTKVVFSWQLKTVIVIRDILTASFLLQRACSLLVRGQANTKNSLGALLVDKARLRCSLTRNPLQPDHLLHSLPTFYINDCLV